MVLLEAAHVTIAALATGLVLGVALRLGGGAVAARRSIPVDPDATSAVGTFVWPAVPFWPVVAIVAATTVLTLVAAVVPTRLATRVAPVEALAE